MKKTRITALLLSCVMLVSVFAGCGKQTKSYATIDGQATDGALFEAYTRSQLSMYTSQGISPDQVREYLKQETGEEGQTYADVVKENSLSYLKMVAAIQKLAKENDIKLTSEEKNTLKEQKNEQINQMGGRSKFVESLKEQHMTEEMYDFLQELFTLQQKVMTALFNKGGKFAIAENDIVKKVMDGNVRVRHIVIRANEQDKDYADKQKKANDALARVKRGDDFETVLKEVGEDPGMNSYVNGYIFNKDGVLVDSPTTTLDPNFTAASFKLNVNQTSEIVKSTSGLHIIKRLPLDEAFVKQHIDEYYGAFASEAYQAKLNEIIESLDVKTNEDYKNLDISAYIDTATPQQQAPAQAPAQAPSNNANGAASPSTAG